MIYAIFTVILAYLLGSISFAIVFSKAFMKKDVRELGSGNAGTTNIMRTGGVKLGALTFLCDVLKGFITCFVGKLVFKFAFQNGDEWAVYGAFLCGLACMLGHVFPIFFQFKGGKGIATSVGIFAVCCWPAILIGLSVFAVGVDKMILIQNSANLGASEVISTYVYKVGLIDGQFGFSTAVNLFNTLVNVTCVLIVNWIAGKVSDTSLF